MASSRKRSLEAPFQVASVSGKSWPAGASGAAPGRNQGLPTDVGHAQSAQDSVHDGVDQHVTCAAVSQRTQRAPTESLLWMQTPARKLQQEAAMDSGRLTERAVGVRLTALCVRDVHAADNKLQARRQAVQVEAVADAVRQARRRRSADDRAGSGRRAGAACPRGEACSSWPVKLHGGAAGRET